MSLLILKNLMIKSLKVLLSGWNKKATTGVRTHTVVFGIEMTRSYGYG